jgi:hypothetical protein
METRRVPGATLALLLVSFILVLCVPRDLMAHCDTMDGPVVMAAKAALQKGDVTPVLKWVKAEHEGEIREAFAKTLEVRKSGTVARDLADRYFFETLVRIHREGEGEPYIGLKPSGTDPGAGIAEADRALDKGSVEDLVRSMTAQMTTGIRDRYIRAVERKKRAEESVPAGREYVEAYVEFIHYVERLQEDVTKSAGHNVAHAEGEEVSAHSQQ